MTRKIDAEEIPSCVRGSKRVITVYTPDTVKGVSIKITGNMEKIDICLTPEDALKLAKKILAELVTDNTVIKDTSWEDELLRS